MMTRTSLVRRQPSIVEISIQRVGAFVILCVPGELTTMAGRRLRQAVKEKVEPAWGPDVQVVVAGLTNTYASYVTTYEEYQIQRYEGASTIYGPHTLDAYIQVRCVRAFCVRLVCCTAAHIPLSAPQARSCLLVRARST